MASEGDAESEYIPNPSFKLQRHWNKKSDTAEKFSDAKKILHSLGAKGALDLFLWHVLSCGRERFW